MVKKPTSAVAWCETHRKLMYPSRKGARKVARLHPDHKVAYECSVQDGYYHVGHLPPAVVEGRITRDRLVEKVS